MRSALLIAMYVLGIGLLIINILLMLFFYFKIKKNFSAEKYEVSVKDRMGVILRSFNFQTNQAITILEERIEEMKHLLQDADKRFVALSNKIQFSSVQYAHCKDEDIVEDTSMLNNLNQYAESKNRIITYQNLQEPLQNDAILKMKVVEMYKNGWSIDFIADKLDMPQEEVRIITFMAKTQE